MRRRERKGRKRRRWLATRYDGAVSVVSVGKG
jgi:hypothetical protein